MWWPFTLELLTSRSRRVEEEQVILTWSCLTLESSTRNGLRHFIKCINICNFVVIENIILICPSKWKLKNWWKSYCVVHSSEVLILRNKYPRVANYVPMGATSEPRICRFITWEWCVTEMSNMEIMMEASPPESQTFVWISSLKVYTPESF